MDTPQTSMPSFENNVFTYIAQNSAAKAKRHSQVEKGMFWEPHLSLGLLRERAFHVCLYLPVTFDSLPFHWVRSVIHIESALTTQPFVLTLICTHLKIIISTRRSPRPRMTSFRKSLFKGNLTKMRPRFHSKSWGEIHYLEK